MTEDEYYLELRKFHKFEATSLKIKEIKDNPADIIQYDSVLIVLVEHLVATNEILYPSIDQMKDKLWNDYQGNKDE